MSATDQTTGVTWARNVAKRSSITWVTNFTILTSPVPSNVVREALTVSIVAANTPTLAGKPQ